MAGVAAAVNNAVARVGGLIAVALLGLVIAHVFVLRAGSGQRDHFSGGVATGVARGAAIEAFRASLGLAILLCLAGALVAALGISNRGAIDAPGAGEDE